MIFSVLIAHYNNSRFLKQAIESVFDQTYPEWEIIIVDDASTDEFEMIIKSYEDYPRIKVYRNDKNYGCGFTKRKCVELSTGLILGFLDPDDALLPDALEIMVNKHQEKPTCSLIYSTHFICNSNLEISAIAKYPRAIPDYCTYLEIGDGSVHAFASFKRDSYFRSEGISKHLKKAVDQDLYYKLEDYGDLFFIDKPLYLYRIHPNSISNFGNERSAEKIHLTIIEEACIRRIILLKKDLPASKVKIKKIRARYLKVRALGGLRNRDFPKFFLSLFAYSYSGGLSNIVQYIRKLPREGKVLLKKTLSGGYEIKA